MKLILENIGKIKNASVEIKGITVIAGENNTGKSTVGKALYCLFSAFHNINEKINNERSSLIYSILSGAFRQMGSIISPMRLRKVAKEICENRELYLTNSETLREVLVKFSEKSDDFSVEITLDKVLAYLSLDDDIIKENVLKRIFMSEYKMQVGHINMDNSQSSVSLEIRGEQSIDIRIVDNKNVEIKKSVNIHSNLAYIEDPFVIDELENKMPILSFRMNNHRSDLVDLLTKKREGSVVSTVIEEMVVSEKLNNIFSILNQICEGNLIETEDNYAYVASKYKEPLSLSNISTGFKTFLILKTLLMNGSIEEKGTIILDEPEIHLHPQWQLVFAELIVLIQKEFNIHILLNTHSPYFLRALQVYSAKYEIADMCKYYLSEVIDDQANIRDVTENIDLIYAKLSDPLQKLEDLRW